MVSPCGLTSTEIHVPSSVSSDRVRPGSSGRSGESADSPASWAVGMARANDRIAATIGNGIARIGLLSSRGSGSASEPVT